MTYLVNFVVTVNLLSYLNTLHVPFVFKRDFFVFIAEYFIKPKPASFVGNHPGA